MKNIHRRERIKYAHNTNDIIFNFIRNYLVRSHQHIIKIGE